MKCWKGREKNGLKRRKVFTLPSFRKNKEVRMMAKEGARSAVRLNNVEIFANTISGQKRLVLVIGIQYGGCMGQLD